MGGLRLSGGSPSLVVHPFADKTWTDFNIEVSLLPFDEVEDSGTVQLFQMS